MISAGRAAVAAARLLPAPAAVSKRLLPAAPPASQWDSRRACPSERVDGAYNCCSKLTLVASPLSPWHTALLPAANPTALLSTSSPLHAASGKPSSSNNKSSSSRVSVPNSTVWQNPMHEWRSEKRYTGPIKGVRKQGRQAEEARSACGSEAHPLLRVFSVY